MKKSSFVAMILGNSWRNFICAGDVYGADPGVERI